MALKIVFRKDAGTTIKAIIEELESAGADPLLQDAVRMVWHYFVCSAPCMEQDYEILYETIKKIVEVESMPTMLEKWTAERKSEWQAETVVKERGKMVLTALRTKFENIPQEIEETVLSMTDPIALESMLVHVFHSNTLDEFASGL
jgi:hypothetical protein